MSYGVTVSDGISSYRARENVKEKDKLYIEMQSDTGGYRDTGPRNVSRETMRAAHGALDERSRQRVLELNSCARRAARGELLGIYVSSSLLTSEFWWEVA